MLNKFHKLACKIAKDDLKKDYIAKDLYNLKMTFEEIRNNTLVMFRQRKWTYEKALDYKNWNKNFKF